MGHKYSGPKFKEFPPELGDRIRRAAKIAEKKTACLGVKVVDLTELYQVPPSKVSKLWGFGDEYREVFVYDFGHFHRAFFRRGDKVYEFGFCGMGDIEEFEEIEKVLGLEVKKLPTDNQGDVLILFDGKPLERLANFGHNPRTKIDDPIAYQCSPSGPYMAR